MKLLKDADHDGTTGDQQYARDPTGTGGMLRVTEKAEVIEIERGAHLPGQDQSGHGGGTEFRGEEDRRRDKNAPSSPPHQIHQGDRLMSVSGGSGIRVRNT